MVKLSHNCSKAVEYLKTDVLKHLSTLKYISIYHEKLSVDLLEDEQDWAVSVTIPTSTLSYDTITYPKAEEAIFINGTSQQLKYRLMDKLPLKNYIVRVNEDFDFSALENRYGIETGKTYISYTSPVTENPEIKTIIPGNAVITDQAIDLIKRNGYSERELRKYFQNNAVWFGITVENELKSVCFIYQNYEDIWEIAGVHTLETERGKGYGRIVVTSALHHLLDKNRIPRYEAEIGNINSINLAKSLGMNEFLRIRHFLLSPLQK